MMVLQLRVALLAGVSASTLGLAVPANAATNLSPGISRTDAIDPVEDTICALADTCDFTVESSGTGSVAATVNDPRHGDL